METVWLAFLIRYGKTVNAVCIPVLRMRLNPPLRLVSRKNRPKWGKNEKVKGKSRKMVHSFTAFAFYLLPLAQV
jgi:hypothetical protein